VAVSPLKLSSYWMVVVCSCFLLASWNDLFFHVAVSDWRPLCLASKAFFKDFRYDHSTDLSNLNAFTDFCRKIDLDLDCYPDLDPGREAVDAVLNWKNC